MRRLTGREIDAIYYECYGFHPTGITGLDTFATAVEKEVLRRAAELCGQTVMRPAGYGGRFEGYGSYPGDKTGQECANELRAVAGSI